MKTLNLSQLIKKTINKLRKKLNNWHKTKEILIN
jgi:hypothetical protein